MTVPEIGTQLHLEDEQGHLIPLRDILEQYSYNACHHIIKITIIEEGAEYHAGQE